MRIVATQFFTGTRLASRQVQPETVVRFGKWTKDDTKQAAGTAGNLTLLGLFGVCAAANPVLGLALAATSIMTQPKSYLNSARFVKSKVAGLFKRKSPEKP